MIVLLLVSSAQAVTRVCVQYSRAFSDLGGGDYLNTAGMERVPGVKITLYGSPTATRWAMTSGTSVGCADFATIPGNSYLVQIDAVAKVDGNNTVTVANAATVSGLNTADPQYPVGSGSPFVYFPFSVLHDQTVTATLPNQTWSRMLGVAAFALNRRRAGTSNTDYRAYTNFTTSSPSPCSAGSSCYKEQSRAIFNSSDARFVIGHELGHMVFARRNNWNSANSSYGSDPFTSVCRGVLFPDGDEREHTFDSKEYQSAAASEGIAHYYAAVTFNNTGQQSCGFDYYKPLDWNQDGVNDPVANVDCEGSPAVSPGSGGSVSSGDYLGDQCSAGGTWNRGSEYDWLRFLWDLDTDTDTGTTIHTTQIADLWDDANPHTWRSGDSGTADRPWTRMAAPCASMHTNCLAKGISNGVTR